MLINLTLEQELSLYEQLHLKYSKMPIEELADLLLDNGYNSKIPLASKLKKLKNISLDEACEIAVKTLQESCPKSPNMIEIGGVKIEI